MHLPAAALEGGLRERGLAIERVSHWRGGQLLFGWLHGGVRRLPGHADLYSAIRRTGAQDSEIAGPRRVAVLLAAAAAGARRRGDDGARGRRPRRRHRVRGGAAPVITGERVTTDAGGFNPTYQRHVAAYRLCAPLLPAGRVLDLGCGTGHSYRELAPRDTVGVDSTRRRWRARSARRSGPTCAGCRSATGPFASVLSVQSIEHVPDPEAVLAEVVRVLEPGGRAVFVTPNRLTFGAPDEIIDPYHYVEYDAPGAPRALCAPFFAASSWPASTGRLAYDALVAPSGRSSDGCSPSIRCGCAAWCPVGCASGSTTGGSPGTGSPPGRARPRSRPDDFTLRRERWPRRSTWLPSPYPPDCARTAAAGDQGMNLRERSIPRRCRISRAAATSVLRP